MHEFVGGYGLHTGLYRVRILRNRQWLAVIFSFAQVTQFLRQHPLPGGDVAANLLHLLLNLVFGGLLRVVGAHLGLEPELFLHTLLLVLLHYLSHSLLGQFPLIVEELFACLKLPILHVFDGFVVYLMPLQVPVTFIFYSYCPQTLMGIDLGPLLASDGGLLLAAEPQLLLPHLSLLRDLALPAAVVLEHLLLARRQHIFLVLLDATNLLFLLAHEICVSCLLLGLLHFFRLVDGRDACVSLLLLREEQFRLELLAVSRLFNDLF